MTDKDLLVVVSELLRKQDQQAEILDLHTKLISKTNERLQELTDISIKEFEWQHKQAEEQRTFNERQIGFNERQMGFNERQMEFNERQDSFNQQFLSALERQQIFNERFLDKLDEISNKL